MNIKLNNKKGTILVLVLGVIFVVVIFSAIIVSLMLSQSRLTKHQVDRTKAYYVGQAASNYALEMMRIGVAGWIPNNLVITKNFCKNITTTCPCDVCDEDFAYNATVRISPKDASTYGTYPLNVTVNYTYTP